MWTRPDGFIYLGAVGVGFLLFNPGGRLAIAGSGSASRSALWARPRSQLSCTCPWLLCDLALLRVHPCPTRFLLNACSGSGRPLNAGVLLKDLLIFPLAMPSGEAPSAADTFLPTYASSFEAGIGRSCCTCKCLALCLCGSIGFCLWPSAGRAQRRSRSCSAISTSPPSRLILRLGTCRPPPFWPFSVFAHLIRHGLESARSLKDKGGAKALGLLTAGVSEPCCPRLVRNRVVCCCAPPAKCAVNSS